MKKLSLLSFCFSLLPIMATCSQNLNPSAKEYFPKKTLSAYLGWQSSKVAAWKTKKAQMPSDLKELDFYEDQPECNQKLPQHRILVAPKHNAANSPLSRDIFGSAL
jgi:hypothetical protein